MILCVVHQIFVASVKKLTQRTRSKNVVRVRRRCIVRRNVSALHGKRGATGLFVNSNKRNCEVSSSLVLCTETKHRLCPCVEGRYQSISKADSAYFQYLATRDAHHHLPFLKRLAKSNYPALAENPTALVIDIDYLVYPPKVDLHPLAEHEKHSYKALPGASANAEARNDELIQRARDHPGKYGLIQSKIANGQDLQSVQTIVPGSFWEGWNGEAMELDEEQDVLAGEDKSDILAKNIDEVDLMMGRLALNRILRSMGQPETF